MTHKETMYDVAIIGAGITGTALGHLLARYTNANKVLLIEKYGSVAQVSSKSTNNSQTLHFGDIETNYALEKAKSVKLSAEMIVRYLERLDDTKGIYRILPKMVLAVGENEVDTLAKRYEEFKVLFPDIKLLDRAGIESVEPNVVAGRNNNIPISAIYTDKGYVMDFGKLAESFVASTKKDNPNGFDLRFDLSLQSIKKVAIGYEITTRAETFCAKTVVVAMGAHSLSVAHKMGYGCDLSIIPVAGNFYEAPNMLNGKVYTVQHKKLPFAAIHGDPEVNDHNRMRFGPIAKAVPILEPRKPKTFFDFMRVFPLEMDTLKSLICINSDPVILKFIAKSFFYDWPIIGKPLFLKEARKIIPTISGKDISYARNFGGIRPQVVNIRKHAMQLGEAKIHGDGIVFNITPSPGASVCLKNAEEDMETIIAHLGSDYHIDHKAFAADFTV